MKNKMNIFRFFPVYDYTQDWHYSHVWTNSSVNRAVLPVPNLMEDVVLKERKVFRTSINYLYTV